MNVTTTLILLLLTAHYLLANLNKSKPLLCIFVLILVKFIINVYCFISLCKIHTAQLAWLPVLQGMRHYFATPDGVEIESSFNALWAPHTTLRVTYALKSPRAKG